MLGKILNLLPSRELIRRGYSRGEARIEGGPGPAVPRVRLPRLRLERVRVPGLPRPGPVEDLGAGDVRRGDRAGAEALEVPHGRER